MIKKILIILLSFFIFFFGFGISSSYAVGGTVPKVVIGSLAEKLIISNGSKAGIKFASKSASEKAIKQWNLDLHEKFATLDLTQQEKINNYLQTVNNAEVIPYPEGHSKFGYGKALISVAAFVTGADILYEIYKEVKNAYDTQNMVEFMEDYTAPDNFYSTVAGMYLTPIDTTESSLTYGYRYRDSSGTSVGKTGTGARSYKEPTYITYDIVDSNYIRVLPVYRLYGTDTVSKYYGGDIIKIPISHLESNLNTVKEVPDNPFPLEVPDYLNNIIELDNYDSISELETAYPDGIAVDVPVNETISDSPDLWNEPLPETLPEPEPIPDDGGTGDGGTGDTGTTNPGDPFKQFPTALLLALFDLLVAIIMYLVRMFEFIVTIPLISALPIDNEAFTYFKNMKIIGINVYEVVSSMAMLGLSFSVYRSIRRVFP